MSHPGESSEREGIDLIPLGFPSLLRAYTTANAVKR